MTNPGLIDGGIKNVHPHQIEVRGNPVTMMVTVDTGARDGGVAGGGSETELLPGLVLGQKTADGKYKDYDTDGVDGSQFEQDCVILAEKIADISTGDTRALVYSGGGSFKWGHLRWRLAGDKSGFAREDSKFAYFGVN